MEVGPFRKTNFCIFWQKIPFPRWLWVLVVAAFIIFWGCSAFRHFNFCSEAFDLGIFSQAVWLISNREDPVSSLLHKHILGDHGAYVLYLISPIYKIFPTAYTLLAIQALVLALVPVPTYLIAEVLEVPKEKTKALCFLSVLHPTLFNSNLFDFHPDALVVPGVLFAFYFAMNMNTRYFILSTILVLSCKEVFSLVSISLGLVLLFVRKRRHYGIIAVLVGLGWFVSVLWIVIPNYSPTGLPAGSERYFQFKGSPTEMFFFFLNRPFEILRELNWLESLNYLKGLILPMLPAVSWRGSLPLLGALPMFLLNSISTEQFQRNYSFHHSLPIIPFLVISCVYSSTNARYKTNKVMLFWVVAFFILVLGKGVYSLGTKYPFPWYRDGSITTVYRKAISLIDQTDAVIAPSHLIPHLANRKKLSLMIEGQHDQLLKYNVVVVDSVNPGWGVDGVTARKYLSEMESNQYFSRIYEAQGVRVFQRKF